MLFNLIVDKKQRERERDRKPHEGSPFGAYFFIYAPLPKVPIAFQNSAISWNQTKPLRDISNCDCNKIHICWKMMAVSSLQKPLWAGFFSEACQSIMKLGTNYITQLDM